MSFTVQASVEYYLGYNPCFIYINSTDNLATVTSAGYLTGDTSVNYSNGLMAVVNTTDGLVILAVSVSGDQINLIPPLTA